MVVVVLVVVAVVAVTVVAVAVTDGVAETELVGLPDSRPDAGGLLDGGLLADAALVASGTPSAAPRTDGTVLPPSRAPMAQMNSTAPTAEPAMATMRLRRYTDGGSGSFGSSTCGN